MNLVSIVQVFTFTKFHLGCSSCDDPDPGLLQTSGFSTGFAAGHYKSAVSMLLWVQLQFELVCDDPRNTVLMMPLSLSLPFKKEKTKEELSRWSPWIWRQSESELCVRGEGRGEVV